MTPSRARFFALGALLLFTWSAPAEAKRKKQAEEAPPPSSGPTMEPSVPGSTAAAKALSGMTLQSQIELVSAGAEPRVALRIHPKAGQVQDIEMVMDMAMAMDVAGQKNQVDMPPMVMTMRVTVGDVAPDGTFGVQTALLGTRVEATADTPPELVAAMSQGFASMQGLVINARMDSQGHTLDGAVSGLADPALQAGMDSLQQNMRQGQVMLPAEPVGVGGSWRSSTLINSSGIPMSAVTTYTVRSMQGDQLELDTTIAMSVDPNAAIPVVPGANVRFTRFDSSGGGTVSWDLGTLMPLSALQYTMNMAMEAAQGDQTMVVGMDMGMKMEMRQAK